MNAPHALARRDALHPGFAAGVLAALVLLGGVLLLRLTTGVVSLPEIVADGVLLALPGALASAIIDTLQKAAKPLLYLGVAAGTLVVGGVLGRYYAHQPGWRRALAIAVGAWLFFGLVAYTLAGAGVFGAGLSAGPWWHGASLLALFLLYAVALRLAFGLLAGRPAPAVHEPSAERRELLMAGALLGGAVVAAGVAWRLLPRLRESEPASSQLANGAPANAAPFDVPSLSAEITSSRAFYTVSKNIIDPAVDASGWKLRIAGLVERTLELTYDELRGLPASDGYYTLMCISNEVGGNLVGNAHWRGVKLRWLLEQAGVRPEAARAVFAAADDYRDSVRIERALHPDALLAWEMNGEPLPREHGFPARLLLPGIYGMENVKWLTGITLSQEDFKGYWQVRGWDEQPLYRTMSRIDVPRARASLPAGSVDVAGVAFAGDRGVRKVEVSTDGGQTWQEAQLKPGLSPYTWQLWRARIELHPGASEIRVRATDGAGDLQVAAEAPPFPSGSTGFHRVGLFVAG